LVETQAAVNRFPDFVRCAVQQIKLFCPTLGKAKIADKLARAGIHIRKTTVGRILQEKPIDSPESTADETNKQCRIVSLAHLARGSYCGADLRWVLDQLDSQRNLATMARVLVGAERHRPLFSALYGSCGIQVPTFVRRSDGGVGSNHVR